MIYVGGQEGSTDDVSTAASFRSPSGLAIDSAGSLFVADNFNHTIRKVSSKRRVTTLAGTAGLNGIVNGVGSNARFFYPSGICIDQLGNVYVTDSGNHMIRKITPEGVVTDVAGSVGNFGSDNGIGDQAKFGNPEGLAVDSAGNIYVADSGNHVIRKITPNYEVTTFAGIANQRGNEDGNRTDEAKFNSPHSISIDDANNLYVTDNGNYAIRKISTDGLVTTLAGGSDISDLKDGEGTSARFISPKGIAIDKSGNLYVADNFAIRKVTKEGIVSTLVGGFNESVYKGGNLPGKILDAKAIVLYGDRLYFTMANAIAMVVQLPGLD